MDRHRLERILARLGDSLSDGSKLCLACAEFLAVTGAGVGFMTGDTHRGSLWASDDTAATVEDLQYTLGEGPSVDAHDSGAMILEADLTAARARRWPAFSPAAVEAGVAAVFAFPLRVGSARFGVLSLYRAAPGPLTADGVPDALVMAELVMAAVVSAQAKVPGAGVSRDLRDLVQYRPQVHQATGVISARMGVGMQEAMVLLRARAYSDSRPVGEVATDILKGTIDLE